jgi:hypothetical protein
MVQGNIAVLYNFPTPLIDVSSMALIINLPSLIVQVPKLIDVKGHYLIIKVFCLLFSGAFALLPTIN